MKGGWGRRYPPLGVIVAALALAVFALPSALNLPQANPGQTLEYAPVSGNQGQAPPGGNLAAVGLGEGGPGGGVAAPPNDIAGLAASLPSLGGDGLTPSTKRCVGNPPRQTEDTLSPPCVAFFNGDNGGATARGVTGSEVRVVYYFDGGAYNPQCSCADPHSTYYDVAQPPNGTEPLVIGWLRSLQRYFNDRYQTYKRFVHLYGYLGSADTSPSGRRADASDNQARLHPFAALAYTFAGNEDSYLTAMASAGSMVFSDSTDHAESFFQGQSGLMWNFPPAIERLAEQYSTWVCQKVVGQPVTYSGNNDSGQRRVIGMLGPDDPAFPGMKALGDLVQAEVRQCGGDIVDRRYFSGVGHITNGDGSGGAQTQRAATQNMAAFKQEGVTTILWVQGFETDHSKAASALHYYPEIFLAGDRTIESFTPSSYEDPTVWSHAWIVTSVVNVGSPDATPCYVGVKGSDPNGDTGGCGVLYEPMRMLFTGIQVAGPRLSATTVGQGFRAIPPHSSSDPQSPACYFVSDDYTCVKDAAQMWWDPSGIPPNWGGGSPGCWRMAQGGRRYLAGSWPAGNAAAEKDTQHDACNSWDSGSTSV